MQTLTVQKCKGSWAIERSLSLTLTCK